MGRLSRFVATLVVTMIAQSGATLAQDLSFRDYPSSSVFSGPNVPPKLDTDRMKEFRTRIREAANRPPDYAGEWSIALWGCGTDCQHGAAVNVRTGKVFFLPGVFTYKVDLQDNDAMEFSLYSRLLIVNGRLEEDSEPRTHFFVIEKSGFRLVSYKPISLLSDEYDGSSAQQNVCVGCGTATTYFAAAVNFWYEHGDQNRVSECEQKFNDLRERADCMSVGRRVFTPPIFDVDGTCTRQFPDNILARNNCVAVEQKAYDLIKIMWIDLTLEGQARCTLQASKMRMYNYTFLQPCLQQDFEINEMVKILAAKKTFRP